MRQHRCGKSGYSRAVDEHWQRFSGRRRQSDVDRAFPPNKAGTCAASEAWRSTVRHFSVETFRIAFPRYDDALSSHAGSRGSMSKT